MQKDAVPNDEEEDEDGLYDHEFYVQRLSSKMKRMDKRELDKISEAMDVIQKKKHGDQ
jgi:hypothetical protein